jgi:hypothetical protein
VKPKRHFLGRNPLFEPLTMEIGSPARPVTCGPVEVSKKIIGKGRKGKPKIKSHKSVILYVVIETEPLERF